MTTEQANEIRKIVTDQGWDAVRNHPDLGKIWQDELAEQQAFESRLMEED
jgi:hypothetical protein